MGTVNPRPNGELQGDSSGMPDRGVNTGVTDTYGANLKDGYNSEGSITSATTSDPADRCLSPGNSVI